MYQKIFKKVLNPLYEVAVKRRKALEYQAFLEKRQWWTYAKLQEFQWSELSKLLEHAYEHVPYWREQFDRLKLGPADIKTYGDFRRLPIIEKKDIRSNYNSMLASNYQGKTWKKSTGGSTGEPLHFEYTPESYDWRVACSKRGYSWAGCEDGIKQAYIWGTAIGKVPALKKIKESLHHRFLRQKYFNCFKFDEKEMAHTIRVLNRYKPQIIVGYTNPLYNFAKFVAKSENINFKPKAIISAAEKLHEFQRKEISKVFGCGVFNTYGSREFMLIASECEEHDGLHINMENLFVEVLKDDGTPAAAGEMGEIVITDLHNYGMPFMRYKIGDMGILSNTLCKCGRGLPLFKEVIGRSLDMIKTPNGRTIPGEFFPHLMKDFKWVKQFQVIQEDVNKLTIKIVKTADFSEDGLRTLRTAMSETIGKNLKVDFEFVDNIPLTETGKFRVTISKIPSYL